MDGYEFIVFKRERIGKRSKWVTFLAYSTGPLETGCCKYFPVVQPPSQSEIPSEGLAQKDTTLFLKRSGSMRTRVNEKPTVAFLVADPLESVPVLTEPF